MQHWSDYWRHSGALNSFAETGTGSGYNGTIATFWQQQLATCSDNANLVDIGTGNGALAALMAEYGRNSGKTWHVTGTDAAAIEPLVSLQHKPELLDKLADISFLGETPIESMPFADGSVDFIGSQFAFEYADAQAGLEEIFRVLKAGGKLVIMAHHHESALVLDSKRGIEIFDYILNQTPFFIQLDLLFSLAGGALRQMDNATWQQTQECIGVTKSIQWTMGVINDRFNEAGDAEWVNDIFGQAVNLIRSVQNLDSAVQASERLAGFFGALKNHHSRIKEQVKVALDAKKLNEIEKIVSELGGNLKAEEITLENELFAYTLTVSK